MKCVILAAGRGERMMPLTAKTPKPLLKVNGKALIDYVLEALPVEIDEVIIVVKYLGNQIKKHVGSKWDNMKIRYVAGSDKGSAYSFLNTKKYLKDERFLLIYGDEIPCPIDVEICLTQDLSILTFKSGGRWVNNGVMVLNTDIFDEEFVFKSMVKQFTRSHKVLKIVPDTFVGEINTPEDLERVEKELDKI